MVRSSTTPMQTRNISQSVACRVVGMTWVIYAVWYPLLSCKLALRGFTTHWSWDRELYAYQVFQMGNPGSPHPYSGKELRTLQERCSQGTSTLCWLSGIVFRIKATSWRNVYKNLHCRMTLGSKAVVSASNTLYSIWTCWVTLVTHPTPL
jgi:hypothetical protein